MLKDRGIYSLASADLGRTLVQANVLIVFVIYLYFLPFLQLTQGKVHRSSPSTFFLTTTGEVSQAESECLVQAHPRRFMAQCGL